MRVVNETDNSDLWHLFGLSVPLMTDGGEGTEGKGDGRLLVDGWKWKRHECRLLRRISQIVTEMNRFDDAWARTKTSGFVKGVMIANRNGRLWKSDYVEMRWNDFNLKWKKTRVGFSWRELKRIRESLIVIYDSGYKCSIVQYFCSTWAVKSVRIHIVWSAFINRSIGDAIPAVGELYYCTFMYWRLWSPRARRATPISVDIFSAPS